MSHPFLDDIRLNAGWIDLLRELEKEAPKIPAWTPQSDNTEDMKYQSARRDGYHYLLSKLRN